MTLNKAIILIIVFSTLVASYITFGLTFVKAYISEEKQVVITINEYGEGHIELIMLLATFLLFVYGFPHFLKVIIKEFEE
jgi:hypothetical protein